jgi:hypothetical protein
MSIQLIERALAEWREGERLLRDLPRLDPDHETVRIAVIGVRETYATLTAMTVQTADTLAECRDNIDRAHDAIVRARARLDSSRK